MAGARPSAFARDEKPAIVQPAVVPTRQWSAQQQAIFDWFEKKECSACQGTGFHKSEIGVECGQCQGNGSLDSLVVRARAGTGKTTTIIEGVNRAPEDFILVCAFNKRIAEELSTRITNPSVEAKTLHSLGFTAIRRQWSRVSVAKGTARADQLTDIVAKDAPKQIRKMISTLHTKIRDIIGGVPTFEEARSLAFFFDLVPDEGWGRYDVDHVVDAAIGAVKHAATVEPSIAVGIDFADMIFLPLVWNLLTADYQLAVVDEGQDMTMAQLTMAQRSCNGRMAIIGDDRQAIYAFRGADSGSLDRLKQELGAVELPLVTTYRCGQSIVRRAQRLVPDIEAGANNPEGIVDTLAYKDLLQAAAPGQFILSRINAPLVSITLALIRQRKRARMAGRDIGAGVKAVMLKLCKGNSYLPVDTMLENLATWETKTVTRLANYGQLDLVDRCHDQADTIRALAEDSDETTVAGLMQTLDWLFQDEHTDDTIVCSSVHKAKGLEADRVYVLMESLYRRGTTPEEENIEYVAVTRAKSHLTQVYEVPGLKKREER